MSSHHLPAGAMPLSEMASACPHPELAASARIDPYWGNLWPAGSGGATVSWRSRRSAETAASAGVGRVRGAAAHLSEAEALDAFMERSVADRLGVLAAVNLWRVLTVEQLAAICGRPVLARRRSRDLDLAWAAGFVQRGRFTADSWGAPRLPALYRPDDQSGFERLRRRLGYHEWLGVTGGRGWQGVTPTNRHHLLAAELSLRVAEYCEVGAVYGEPLSAWPLLLPEPVAPASSRRCADAVWTRTDGGRIVVELVASRAPNLERKIDAWAAALAADATRANVVLFVDASSSAKLVRRAIARAATGSMDAVMQGVPERMALVRWEEWFPAPGMVAPGFASLSCWRPTGPGERAWERASALDPFEMACPGADPSCLGNVPLVWGTPHWLRNGPAPDLTEVVLARAGMSGLRRLLRAPFRFEVPRPHEC